MYVDANARYSDMVEKKDVRGAADCRSCGVEHECQLLEFVCANLRCLLGIERCRTRRRMRMRNWFIAVGGGAIGGVCCGMMWNELENSLYTLLLFE